MRILPVKSFANYLYSIIARVCSMPNCVEVNFPDSNLKIHEKFLHGRFSVRYDKLNSLASIPFALVMIV